MEEIEFKFSVDWTKPGFFCGLDVHKYELAVAVYSKDDSQSDFLKTAIFSTDSTGLKSFWQFIEKFRPRGFVMEATGIYHHLIFRFLQDMRAKVDWPFKILVINPADASGIPGRQKNDKIDAENLARYLSMGLFKDGKAVIEVLEDLKAIFRTAVRIEKDRTALKNRIKKTLDRAGIRPKGFDLNHEWVREFLHYYIEHDSTLGECLSEINKDKTLIKKHRYKILKNLKKFVPYYECSLTSAQRAIIRQDLVELDFKSARKSLLAVEIDQMLLDRPGLRQKAYILASIPGISSFSAVWILAEIGNIQQFPTKHQLLAYCGCCPRVVSSAGKVYSAHVSRHSNAYLRTIFYNAAVVTCNLLKKDSALKDYAKYMIKRKGSYSMKLVYCIVAAKIVKITHAVLRDNLPFDPEKERSLRKQVCSLDNKDFSVFDRKLIRQARNSLRRVNNVDNIGLLGKHSLMLAEQLENLLQRKNVNG
jgi:transposase